LENLRNRLIFKAADEEGALGNADFFGQNRVIKKSRGYQRKNVAQLFRAGGAQNKGTPSAQSEETHCCSRALRTWPPSETFAAD